MLQDQPQMQNWFDLPLFSCSSFLRGCRKFRKRRGDYIRLRTGFLLRTQFLCSASVRKQNSSNRKAIKRKLGRCLCASRMLKISSWSRDDESITWLRDALPKRKNGAIVPMPKRCASRNWSFWREENCVMTYLLHSPCTAVGERRWNFLWKEVASDVKMRN